MGFHKRFVVVAAGTVADAGNDTGIAKIFVALEAVRLSSRVLSSKRRCVEIVFAITVFL
jgi:hypothetical protein